LSSARSLRSGRSPLFRLRAAKKGRAAPKWRRSS
jgi:hypothetical protein